MTDNDRFYLCLTCGRLKHKRLFETGDCTCQDCYDEVERGYRDDARVRYLEAPDGDGFVLTGQNKSKSNLDGAKSITGEIIFETKYLTVRDQTEDRVSIKVGDGWGIMVDKMELIGALEGSK